MYDPTSTYRTNQSEKFITLDKQKSKKRIIFGLKGSFTPHKVIVISEYSHIQVILEVKKNLL